MYLKTEGIVLREVELGEADKLLDILSRDRGLLTVKAKGVRRAKSPLKSACQILTLSEFTLFDYRGKLSVQEAEPLEQFRGLRENLEQLALGSYFAQATGAVAQEDAPNPELISLLCNALFALSKLGRPQALVKAAFELRLMCLSGYAPELSCCAVCGKEPEQPVLSLDHGRLCCRTCSSGMGERAELGADALAAMRYIASAPAKQILRFSLGEDALLRLSDAAERYLLRHAERGFSTLDYWKNIRIIQ